MACDLPKRMELFAEWGLELKLSAFLKIWLLSSLLLSILLTFSNLLSTSHSIGIISQRSPRNFSVKYLILTHLCSHLL